MDSRYKSGRAGAKIFGSSRISLHATPGGKRWRVHHARHRVLRVGRGGAHRASLRTSGTAGRWTPGREPSAFFFWNTFPAAAPRGPPFRLSSDARSREPSPRANLRGNAPGLLAGPGFARSRIGCSWRPAPVRLRQDVDAGLGTRMAGYVSPKKFSWPPAALPSLCRSRRVHARVERPPPAAVP